MKSTDVDALLKWNSLVEKFDILPCEAELEVFTDEAGDMGFRVSRMSHRPWVNEALRARIFPLVGMDKAGKFKGGAWDWHTALERAEEQIAHAGVPPLTASERSRGR